jgi:dihydroorotase
MTTLIRGGRVLDPASGSDAALDLLVEGENIARMGKGIAVPAGARVLDAAGCAVVPGLIDMHCHLREPGYEYKETVATACADPVRGGFTSLLAMANTSPVNDRGAVTEFILARAREAALCRVYPVGALTQGQGGEALSEMGELARAGCVALSDDGRPVADGALLRRALEYADAFGLLVIDHAEDLSIAGAGVMAEGAAATRLGLEVIPAAAYDAAIARDIAVARDCGRRLHLAHVSTRGGVELVRRAKAEGVRITAETCPHYFTLTDEAVADYDTAAKVRPPLGTAADREAVIAGLSDGTLDVLATDHAPHHRDEKDCEFARAAFGISGLETALSLTIELAGSGRIPLLDLIARWTLNPARILGLPQGRLAAGAPADLALVDMESVWTVDPAAFASKGRNTPFAGRTLPGVVRATMTAGRVVYERKKVD